MVATSPYNTGTIHDQIITNKIVQIVTNILAILDTSIM